ncbi:MAG: 3'-5' exonuclease, partial [bacterium]
PPGVPPLLNVMPLNQSQRSAPVIIRLVNQVFRDLDASGLPAGALARWRRHWGEHEAAKAAMPGHTAFYELPRPTGRATAADSQRRYQAAAERLLAVRPWERRLTAAVLVRTNDSGRAVLDVLRGQGIPASWFGEETLGDNPAVTAVLALLKAAAHPADTFAWEHLMMTPLAALVRGTREAFTRTLLTELHRDGFESVLRRWCRQVKTTVALDPFSSGRLDELLVAAQEFDAAGTLAVPDFLEFALGWRVQVPPAAKTVQVMTIHKSKGLGFDLVLLPDLQSTEIAGERRIELGVQYDANHEPEWVLEMPKKDIARADAALRRRLTAGEDARAYESLCVLYVALTRAKHSLTIITTQTAERSEALSLAKILRNALVPDDESTPAAKKTGKQKAAPADAGSATAPAGNPGLPSPVDAAAAPLPPALFEDGAAAWYEQLLPTVPETPVPGLAPLPATGPVRPRFPRRLPSQPMETEVTADALFAPEAGRGRDFGSAIHALFQQLEWWAPGRAEAIVAAWKTTQATAPPTALAEMEAVWLAALRTPEIRASLTRPAGPCWLWREKSFEVILDGAWVSGAFDRVVVQLDAAGRPRTAVILDYKSNQIREESDLETLAGAYRPQMTLYRQALARILGIKSDTITVQLLFLRARRLVTV